MITKLIITAVAATGIAATSTPASAAVTVPTLKTYTLDSSQTEQFASQHCSPLNRPCVKEKNLANQALAQGKCLKVLVVKKHSLSAVSSVGCNSGTSLPQSLEHLLPKATNQPATPWW